MKKIFLLSAAALFALWVVFFFVCWGIVALSMLLETYPNLLDTCGKTFENESASVTMTIRELEELERDPAEVFRYFCREELGVSPDERLIGLFREAMDSVGEVQA